MLRPAGATEARRSGTALGAGHLQRHRSQPLVLEDGPL